MEDGVVIYVNVEEVQVFNAGGGNELLKSTQADFDAATVAAFELGQEVKDVPGSMTPGDGNEVFSMDDSILIGLRCAELIP